ncbi:hypothetical protein KC980_04165 [candidate division WWE3 bacterium]|uniref:Uncharacterized protein n=1 Tax=candidate division WWE3 bacterium TaxID=2053526 RepID=A0A955ECZ5_UNCKA|nr:hypothetical protein [candidate division WWE3 bacterium]
MKNPVSRYIIRKYVYASSVKDAIKQDKQTEVADIWIDDDWKRLNDEIIKETSMGFRK